MSVSLELAKHQLCEPPPLPAKIMRQPPVRIDTLLTKEEFLALIAHMANGNPRSHFLTIYRDDDGEARFARAKGHKNLHAQASWTYDSVAGRAKSNSSMGLYPKNPKNESTWGALDFDAHDGNDEVAKDRSIRAFSLLLEYRDRYQPAVEATMFSYSLVNHAQSLNGCICLTIQPRLSGRLLRTEFVSFTQTSGPKGRQQATASAFPGQLIR